VSTEKPNVTSGAGIFYTKNFSASFAVLQGLETMKCLAKLKEK